MKPFTIVGAGLVGSLQAVFLAKRGYPVRVFEKRPDIRSADIYQGRSINLAMSNRGWRALKTVGIEQEIKSLAIPMYKRTMHDRQGNLSYQPYGQENEAIYSVSRGELNKKLLQLADAYPQVELFFNHRCGDIDLENQVIRFHREDTGEDMLEPYTHLLGTDGAFSAVRQRLMFTDRFNYSQDFIAHGYKELSIEPNEDGSHKLEAETLHIWPREDFMLIALPNIDGSFTCTLFLAFEGAVAFENLKTDPEIIGFFQYYFPDIIPLIPDFLEQFKTHPTSSLVTTRCFPWNYGDSVLLMGDAAHAIVPFYGQGMNAGFEDCTLFDRMLDEMQGDMHRIFPEFSHSRKPNGDAVAELALRNFVEMRDLTADPEFLLRKKIEARLSKKYPDKWIPLYSMVTFQEFPYADALKLGTWQDEVMRDVMNRPDIAEVWDSEEVEQAWLKRIQ